MTDPKDIAELAQKLSSAAFNLKCQYERAIENLPQPEETLADLLYELAEASEAMTTFHKDKVVVNPDAEGYARYADPKAFEQAWTTTLHRHDKAVARLVTYARALRESKGRG